MAEPGLGSHAPGRGVSMAAPVSVCHQVSTIGHRPPPTTCNNVDHYMDMCIVCCSVQLSVQEAYGQEAYGHVHCLLICSVNRAVIVWHVYVCSCICLKVWRCTEQTIGLKHKTQSVCNHVRCMTDLVIPVPGLGVDWLSHRSQDAQTGQITVGHMLVSGCLKGPDQCGSCVELPHLHIWHICSVSL